MINATEIKLWATMCHRDEPERTDVFNKSYGSLCNLNVDKFKIIVNSNVNFDSSIPIEIFDHSDPWMLVWAHKQYMREFLESDYTHFLHIESNLFFKQSHLDYWLRTRDLFQRNNLNFLPALNRIQYTGAGLAYSLDSAWGRGSNRPVVEVEGKRFISIEASYQGMFIMNRRDVEEHINSKFFTFGQHNHGVRESSNQGNAYLNVPNGYQHRMMTPVENFEESWIHHIADNYANYCPNPAGWQPIQNFLDDV
jgi:hypothetical protein